MESIKDLGLQVGTASAEIGRAKKKGNWGILNKKTE